jgi:CheY-like chemotaxis protein
MPKKILLADDSITIQKVVELTFSDGDYEVTAVNNGAKAIQKLSEMRPDIILSDIIMPEKNGYEVCEYVKSHPEFRTIPVVLLTGTFEPFDPDRADKAGCDAVVTKPFESQSLIHKVEELIENARSEAKTQPPSPSPFASGSSPFSGESAFSSASPAPAASTPPPPADKFSTGAFQPHGSDIFNAPPPSSAPSKDMPFESPSPAMPEGETRAFPRMNFDDLQKMSEPSTSGGETRAFPKMNFDEKKAEEKSPAPPPPTSPWHDETPPVETRAFPRMSFDDLKKESEPKPAEPTPWVQENFAGETRAFPRLSFDESSQPTSGSKPAEKQEQPMAASSPSGELTDEQIDRIARRVVQMMSDQVVRTIAWEVIPDLAEMVVKERIRQLENE